MIQPRPTRPITLLWLQAAGCGGCTMSLLGAEAPLLWDRLEAAGIELLWHPALSEASGDEFHRLIKGLLEGEHPLDLLCIEGAVITGPQGSGGFHLMGGSDQPMMKWVQQLAQRAAQVIAVGSCAAFGGITAAGDNPLGAVGLQYSGHQPGGLLGRHFRTPQGLPVVNLAGCPIHPDWVSETLARLAKGQLDPSALDELARPRCYSDHLVHHGCPRNEFYEYKASAEQPGDLGCMMEHLGCLGTQARADCNLRGWNGSGSCVRGGFPCINCTDPDFAEPHHPFAHTAKIAGIPVGLPTDMPKAWFVALASLAKAATPERLQRNATADHILLPPGNTRRRPK